LRRNFDDFGKDESHGDVFLFLSNICIFKIKSIVHLVKSEETVFFSSRHIEVESSPFKAEDLVRTVVLFVEMVISTYANYVEVLAEII
jgi:hypothetical protein